MIMLLFKDGKQYSKMVFLISSLFLIAYAISRVRSIELESIPVVFTCVGIIEIFLIYFFEDRVENKETPKYVYFYYIVSLIFEIIILGITQFVLAQTMKNIMIGSMQLCALSFLFGALAFPQACKRDCYKAAHWFFNVGMGLAFLLIGLYFVTLFVHIPDTINLKSFASYGMIIAVVVTILLLLFFIKSYFTSVRNYKKLNERKNKNEEVEG